MTDRYGVIGHPITHSKSPVIHRLFAQQTDQDLTYEAFDIPPESLGARLLELVADGIRGFNVTVPHKQAVIKLIDELSERAQLAGAVNTLTVRKDDSLAGDNTDGVGLITDLVTNLGLRLENANTVILGAGGATRGIVPALLQAAVKDLRIANRTVGKARELAEEFGGLGGVSACSYDELAGYSFDLVINATSAGLTGMVPPFPASIIGEETVCYDLSYAMADTPFVTWAVDHGALSVHQGWGMLVEQAAESFEIWRGVRPDTGSVLDKLP
jgi:shikimate dehydrogenase